MQTIADSTRHQAVPNKRHPTKTQIKPIRPKSRWTASGSHLFAVVLGLSLRSLYLLETGNSPRNIPFMPYPIMSDVIILERKARVWAQRLQNFIQHPTFLLPAPDRWAENNRKIKYVWFSLRSPSHTLEDKQVERAWCCASKKVVGGKRMTGAKIFAEASRSASCRPRLNIDNKFYAPTTIWTTMSRH